MAQAKQTRAGCSATGLLGCGCGLLGMIGIIVIFLMLGFFYAKERMDQAWNRHDFNVCQQHLKYLGKALASFERDNHHLPRYLAELQPHYLDSPDMLRCPLEGKKERQGSGRIIPV